MERAKIMAHDNDCTCITCMPDTKTKYRLMVMREDFEGQARLKLSGRLDANTSSDHGQEIMAALEDSQELVLDLTDLNYIASAGVRVLLLAAKRAQATGKSLKLQNLHPNVHDVLSMVGMLEIFNLK